jgi:hypothetical protein
VGGDRRFQLTDHVADLSEPQPCPELDLQQRHPGLVEACAVRGDPVAVAGGLEHIAAVEPQRGGAQVDGTLVVSGLAQPRRGGRCAQGGERVHVGRFDVERVAALAAGDYGRAAERPAQHRDLRLQCVAAGADAVGSPEVLDEPVGPDEFARLEREAHHQLGCLAGGDGHVPPVAGDLEGTQHRHGKHLPSVCLPEPGRCQVAVSGSSVPPWTVRACASISRSCSAS